MRKELGQIWRQFRESPFFLQALLVLVVLSIPIVMLLEKVVTGRITYEQQTLINSLKSDPLLDLLLFQVIRAGLEQEFFYRGPIRLLVLFAPQISRKNIGLLLKIFAWLVIIMPMYFWVPGHPDAVQTVLLGLACGWTVLKTRSLESAVLIHMGFNALNLIGGLIQYRFF